MSESPFVLWFDELDRSCLAQVGGKNASLGELTKAGIRVPPGFAVTTEAYQAFLDQSDIRDEISRLLAPLHPDDIPAVEAASRAIRPLMSSVPVPDEITEAIRKAYIDLVERIGVDDLPVAVRSSATAEDLPGASFAGQQDTYLWVQGAGHVLIRTLVCWSSLFTPRAIIYRMQMGFPHDKVLISVGVQKMANARAAGVMFTLNPLNGDRTKIAINANWGLGETVVAGEVTPDEYWVDKVTLEIVQRTISPKMVECLPDPHLQEVTLVPVPPERQTQPCMTDQEVVELARLGKRIERHYGQPQDIEWAVDQDLLFPKNVVILQSRPETVWSQKQSTPILRPQEKPQDYVVNYLLGRLEKRK
ncbi:MAG: PEP/pyruvate-binding domain-containing protein [Anaerolineae bacterium]